MHIAFMGKRRASDVAGDARETKRRVAILLPTLEAGGAERVALNLAEEFSQAGLAVDLVAVRAVGALVEQVPPAISIEHLGAKRSLTAIPALRRYFRRAKPSAALAINFEMNVAAAIASLGIADMKLILSVHSAPHAALAVSRPLWGSMLSLASRLFYRRADHVVAVSKGIAEDLQGMNWATANQIVTIYNPIIRSDLPALLEQRIAHRWLDDRNVPVLVAVGRLTEAKNFPGLLRAFALVLAQRPARLIIVGEGELRQQLEGEAEALGLAGHVDLAGYQPNPYPFLRAADLFVLSSTFEGFGNVLVEAMAAGTPVVSTDCRHGPREILEDGRWGILCAPDDDAALADAILQGLDPDRPGAPSAEDLQRRAATFHAKDIAAQYLRLL